LRRFHFEAEKPQNLSSAYGARKPTMTGAAHQGVDPPLWQKLQAVARVVSAVHQGGSTTTTLEQTSASIRAGVQALSFQALRNLGRAQALRSLIAPRLPPPAADALLCCSLALGWNHERTPFDLHTLVNQTVEAAKRHPATRAQANFINACMRRFLRERDFLVAATNSTDTAFWNHPQWWIKHLKADYPNQWQHILQANNCQAPMTLRINQAKISQRAYLERLASEDIGARANGKYGVTLAFARSVLAIPGFADGLVSVQDAAAQKAAPLLLGRLQSDKNLRILDACAAPGGKTAHLLEMGQSDITSIDIDGDRIQKVQQNLERLGLNSKQVVGDAAKPNTWWDGRQFDAILLDAPCTASGIVRRHPDVRWLRRESDIDQLAGVQALLLNALWPLLKPGGHMLYCTCSVFHAEGSSQIQTFLAHNTDATLMPSPGHLLPQLAANPEGVPDNSVDDHDGFFLALLEKRAD
jgi:16S rRNA (cytosine967-C5)-methyltransferase